VRTGVSADLGTTTSIVAILLLAGAIPAVGPADGHAGLATVRPTSVPALGTPTAGRAAVRPSTSPDYIGVGQDPYALAYDPENNTIFSANGRSGNVSVISGSTNSVVATLASDRAPLAGAYANDPNGMTYDPKNGNVYLVNEVTSNVSVINGLTYSPLASIHLGRQPEAICYDSTDEDLYVASANSLNVTVIAGSNNSILQNISLPAHVNSDLDGIACAPSIDTVYIVNGDGELFAISDLNNSITGSIWIGGETEGATFDPANGFVYVTDLSENEVHVVNGTRWAGNMSVSATPNGIAYDNRTGELFVAIGEVVAPCNIEVINTTTWAESYLPVGNTPDGVAIDTSNDTVYAADELGANVAVLPAETLNGTNFSVEPTPVPADREVEFSVDVVGGVPPIQFNYTGLPPGCAGADREPLQCVPSRPGEFVIGLAVSDAVGDWANFSTNLSVVALLNASVLTATPAQVGVGQSTTLSATVTGGLAPLEFAYAGLPEGCVSVDSASLQCVPTAPGSYHVSFWTNDSAGQSATSSTDLQVDPGWVYPIDFQEHGLTTGESWTVTLDNLSQSSGDTGIEFFEPNATAYTFHVAPLNGYVAEPSNGSLRVAGSGLIEDIRFEPTYGVPAPVVTSFAAAPASVDVGSNVVLSASIQGGTLPLSFAYTDLPGTCTTANSSTLNCTPSTVGSWRVMLRVTDALGRWATANTTLAVRPLPAKNGTSPLSTPNGSSTGFEFSGLSPVVVYSTIAGAVALLVLAGILLRRRSRAREPPGPR
jgi:YVTN family beta-propeller protein